MAQNNDRYNLTLPYEVWNDITISPGAKLLYGEIRHQIDKDTKDWYMLNAKELAYKFNVTSSAVEKWIKQLKDNNFIKVVFNHGKNYPCGRCIWLKY